MLPAGELSLKVLSLRHDFDLVGWIYWHYRQAGPPQIVRGLAGLILATTQLESRLRFALRIT